MRNPYVAALVGAIACVSVEAFVLSSAFGPSGAGTMGHWIIVCAVVTGPGALLLGVPYAHALEDQVDQGASRGRVLALGTLGGAPVGLVNVVATLFVLSLIVGSSSFAGPAERSFWTSRDSVTLLAAALCGGAAQGLGCAWWISWPAEEPPE